MLSRFSKQLLYTQVFQRSFCSVRPPVTQLSEDERILKESVRKFAEEEIRPLVAKMDENSEMDDKVIQGCFEQGFMGLDIPEKYNGAGLNFFSSVLVIEELARVDPSVSVMVDVQNTLVNIAIQGWGTEAQKDNYLPKLATNTLGSFCLSEWSSGSDAFSLKTKAEKKGNTFVLNGSKAWITNAKQAGVFIVMANLEPEKGYKGITAFLVDRNNPGLVVGKAENKLGIRASSTCEVQLNDCVVDESAVLGEIGKGYQIAIRTLNKGRVGIGAQMVGCAQGAFDLTVPYLNQREQFKQKLADFQAIQHQTARAASDIEIARVLVYNAGRGISVNETDEMQCSIAKLISSEKAESVTSMCVNLLGGVGFTKDLGVEKYYRDAKIGQIYEGTSNIQLQTMAKQIFKQY